MRVVSRLKLFVSRVETKSFKRETDERNKLTIIKVKGKISRHFARNVLKCIQIHVIPYKSYR